MWFMFLFHYPGSMYYSILGSLFYFYSLTEKVFIEIFRAAADAKVAILRRL